MARITVEDCLGNVENLFQLVLLAAQRARRLANGSEPTVAWENDKPTVVALREIAAGNVTVMATAGGNTLRQHIVNARADAITVTEIQP